MPSVISFGGIMCVIYAALSGVNADFLNPSDRSAFSPKLALQFASDSSPPVSATYWLLWPIANTETAWTIESFDGRNDSKWW